MSKYIKGDAVANATSYELHEKVGSNYNLLSTKNVIDFNLDEISFESGEHILVVKAKADGFEDSDYSNEVAYTIADEPAAPADELSGTWYMNEHVSKDNFGGKPANKAQPEGLGFSDPAAGYTGYLLDFSLASNPNNKYLALVTSNIDETVGMIVTSGSAGALYYKGAWMDEPRRTWIINSKLSEVENGDVLLAWMNANGTKIA